MLQPSTFSHRTAPSKLVFGDGALSSLASELAEIGVRRPVVVAGRRTSTSLAGRAVREALAGLEVAEIADMPPHSPVGAVRRLRDLASAHRADGFVAVGGGSGSDACKIAALWLAEGGELADHAVRFRAPSDLHVPSLPAPKLPVVAIPTTLSAAEVTMGASVRTDDGRKMGFLDLKIAARLVVIDPAASVDVPADVFVASGMNGLAHCIEGAYSRVRTPITTALALHGAKLFVGALPRVALEPGSAQARGEALVAAHLSGQVLVNARSCLHHAICHVLGAVAGISHGDANSIVLPHVMAFNLADPGATAAMAECAVAMGSPEARADAAIDRVRALQARIGVPTRLRDVGVRREVLAEVAGKTMAERGLYMNPRAVTGPREIEAVLEAAW